MAVYGSRPLTSALKHRQEMASIATTPPRPRLPGRRDTGSLRDYTILNSSQAHAG